MEEYRLVPWDSEKQKPKQKNKKHKSFVFSLLSPKYLPSLIIGTILGLGINDGEYKLKYERAIKTNKKLVEIAEGDLRNLKDQIDYLYNPELIFKVYKNENNEISRYKVKLDDYLNFFNEHKSKNYSIDDLKKMNAIKITDPNQ